MIDISITGLKKAFDVEKNILDGVCFNITEGERVGLLGKNGAGKSTIFKIICGELKEDEGSVMVAPGKRLGLISQIPVYPAGYTVMDVLRSAFLPTQKIRRALLRLEEKMAEGSADDRDIVQYGDLGARFEALGGYGEDVEINKLCNGLGIPETMRDQQFEFLSGGEQTRVNLARLILEKTDILLLDEPTNHLDMQAVEWLEEYLLKYKGTVLAISHDRYFLDRVVTRIIEIKNGRAEFYSGNYSFYVMEKERRYLEQLHQYEKAQAKIAQLEKAADKLRLWAFLGNDKLYKRAFSMEKRIDKMETVERPDKEKTMSMSFSEREFKADELIVVKNLAKSYGDKSLFTGVELKAGGGERIGIIGENGTGKSTFLRILLGLEAADDGSAKFGPSVVAAYLPQQVTFEDERRTLVDTLIYELDCTPQTARNRLGAFMFSGDDVFKPVSALSGGERSRLKLCMIMNDDINLLILDEPTNHLDISSREWIENSVESYNGALLFVSHDRYFIRKFATRIWDVGDGAIRDYKCGYEEYRAIKDAEKAAIPPMEVQPKEKKPRQKRTKSPEKQMVAVERSIEKLEARRAELETAAEEAARDYEALMEINKQIEELSGELSPLYDEWEELAQLLED